MSKSICEFALEPYTDLRAKETGGVMKILILTISLATTSLTFAGDSKCLQKKDFNDIYSSAKMKYISNYGHVLAMNTEDFDREAGYKMDIYAQKQVAVKKKNSNEISHYKSCLIPIQKNMHGKYIYGSFSASGVDIRTKQQIQRVSFVGR